jgi:hypothetical protein
MDKELIKSILSTAVENGATVVMSGEEYKALMFKCSVLIETEAKQARQYKLLYEGARDKVREMENDNNILKSTISIMSDYLSDSLETFEAMFESDEGCFPYGRMADYVMIARFMQAYKGRKCIADRVEERMKALPF